MTMEGLKAFYDKCGVSEKGNIAKPYPKLSMALIPCRKKDNIIGGNNSLCFSLIHYAYIYAKANLTFLIDYNSIRQVS